MAAALRRLLAYEELRDDARLRLLCAALLLFYCHSFGIWHENQAAALSTFASENFNVLPGWLVHVLGGPAFLGPFWVLLHFSLLYFCGLLGLFFLFRRECFVSMAILAFLFVNKAYYYLSDLRLAADFHHIHLFLTLLFLISRSKAFFFRMGLLTCYLLLALSKLNPSWLSGEYFLSTIGNVPIIPSAGWALRWLCPLWVAWEFIGPFLWFSARKWVRAASIGAFAASHVFCAAVGRPDFSLLMLPLLLIAFWKSEEPVHAGYRFVRSHLISWAYLGILLTGGIWHLFIPGDVRLTGEGRLLGLPSSDVNRAGACRVVVEKGAKRMVFEVEWPWHVPTMLEDGTHAAAGVPNYKGEFYIGGKLMERFPWRVIVREGPLVIWNPYPFLTIPYDALEPYVFYLYGERVCRDYKPDRLGMEFDLQLDGRRERARLLDIPDFCAPGAAYHPFRRNDWIRIPGPEAGPPGPEPARTAGPSHARHRP